MALQPLTVCQKLDELSVILANLPLSLPDVSSSTAFPFCNYVVDREKVEDLGSVGSAINQSLEIIFGYKTRSTGDGRLNITERGAGICAVVDVLRIWASQGNNPEGDGMLLKWIDDIRDGARKVYENAEEIVCYIFLHEQIDQKLLTY